MYKEFDLSLKKRSKGVTIILFISSICAKGAQCLSRLGLIQFFMLSYLQVMFTNTSNCYSTIAFMNVLVTSIMGVELIAAFFQTSLTSMAVKNSSKFSHETRSYLPVKDILYFLRIICPKFLY